MKQKAMRDISAFTRIELIVVIVVVAVVLVSMILPRFGHTKQRSRITCLNVLKEIGIGYRLWAADHGGRNPADQTVINGGWGDFRRDWLSHAEPTTNWPAGHVPVSPSIRLVFP
ncbi:MAG: hypothetical protein ABSG78_01590 [Verrucomicrobiota bacterium]|jgi:type II secretory pathway pseudopilin PulG